MAPAQAGPETGFEDVADTDKFAAPITWLRLEGITLGCNPPANTAFCPKDTVSRGQMAALLARSLRLHEAAADAFTDDDGSVFEQDIDRIAAAGITLGCNPPDNDQFCPGGSVLRGQMAAFIVRAFRLPGSDTDWFADDNGSAFEDDINALAAAGVTLGCNPPASDRFCPRQPVTREQMAAFLWRAQVVPAMPSATRLVAAGDIGRCELTSDDETAGLLDELFAGANGAVAALGDTVYNSGSPQEFRDCYDPQWGRHRFRTRPAVGNHEYRTPDAAGYFAYFGDLAGDPDKGWYSYTLGTWRILVLNSNCDEIGGCQTGSAQHNWLQAELAASSTLCTLAYMHHPRFSSGWHGDDDRLVDIWSTLESHRVETVLAGHDHNYERLAPLTAEGTLDLANGIQSFVVGTGGTYLRSATTGRPGSEVLIDDSHGVLVLDLEELAYTWRFVDTNGGVRDQGSRACH
jgi:hypothetical protein